MIPDSPPGDIRVTWSIRSPVVGYGRPHFQVSISLLRPFAGVLGPWQPSIGDLPARLSFLALSSLVYRVLHTTESVPSELKAEPTLSEGATPETTTIYRLLRAADEEAGGRGTAQSVDGNTSTSGPDDHATDEESSRTVETLHEVFRWRPLAAEGPTPLNGATDGRWGVGKASHSFPFIHPPTVKRTFRMVPGGREDDREPVRGRDRTVGENHGESERGAVTAERSGTAATPGRRENRSHGQTGDVRAIAGLRPSADGFRPVLSTAGTPTVLHRPISPGRSPASDVPGGDWPAVRTESHSDKGRNAKYETVAIDEPAPKTRNDRLLLTFQRPQLAPITSAHQSSPMALSPTEDDAAREAMLTYRNAGSRSTHDSASSKERGPFRTGGRTDSAAAIRDSWSADPNDRLGADTPMTGRSPPSSEIETPSSPFVSFADTDAVADHLYRAIKRRQRIERERRGL